MLEQVIALLAQPEMFVFLVLVAVGVVTQTVTGFAMGLVIVAGVAVLDIFDIAFAAAVVGLLSLANSLVALRRDHTEINLRLLGVTCLTLVPMLVAGVWMLDWLSGVAYGAVKQLLGAFIIVSGGLLLARPRPFESSSSNLALLCTGVFGGLAAGLYSAGGSVLAYVMYRQPLALVVVRSTLLSFFLVTTVARTVVITINGQLTSAILLASLVSLPLVVVGTWATGRVRDRMPEKWVRRLTAVVLAATGIFLVGSPLL